MILRIALFLTACLWAPVTGALEAGAPEPTAVPVSIRRFEARVEEFILEHTNRMRRLENLQRTMRGEPLLKDYLPESQLRSIARMHSEDMLGREFFDHVNPDEMNPHDRIIRAHRRLILRSAGENIWKREHLREGNAELLAMDIVRGWMRSPGHRANLLSMDYTHLGVGVVVRDDVIVATQNFANVAAYLTRPLPRVMWRGETLRLEVEYPGKWLGELKKVDFWNPDTNRVSGKPVIINQSLIRAHTGMYQIRFYFSVGDEQSWEIIPGPLVYIR